jgi:hypothetical protein
MDWTSCHPFDVATSLLRYSTLVIFDAQKRSSAKNGTTTACSLRKSETLITDCYSEGVKEDHTANYFSHSNQTATQMRDKIAEESLEMLIDWLKTKGGNVGIHGTHARVL